MNNTKIVLIVLLSALGPAASAGSVDDILDTHETYGRDIYGLTFKKVNSLLNSHRFYEGRMNREYFKQNGIKSHYHPFNINTLAKCIENAHATPQEKDALWSRLLYKSSAQSTTKYDKNGYLKTAKVGKSFESACKKGLRALEKTEAEEWKSKLIFDSSRLGIVSFVAGCCLRFAYLLIWHSHETFTFGEDALLGTPSIEWNVGVRFWDKTWPTISLAIGALAGCTLSLISKLPSTKAAKHVEKLLGLHEAIVNHLKGEYPGFPDHFSRDLQALKAKLSEMSYTTEAGINREKLKAYLSAILEYHDNLVKQSTPT